mgnify:CR=1 FL=1
MKCGEDGAELRDSATSAAADASKVGPPTISRTMSTLRPPLATVAIAMLVSAGGPRWVAVWGPFIASIIAPLAAVAAEA